MPNEIWPIDARRTAGIGRAVFIGLPPRMMTLPQSSQIHVSFWLPSSPCGFQPRSASYQAALSLYFVTPTKMWSSHTVFQLVGANGSGSDSVAFAFDALRA